MALTIELCSIYTYYVAYTHRAVTMLRGECSGLACAGKVRNDVIIYALFKHHAKTIYAEVEAVRSPFLICGGLRPTLLPGKGPPPPLALHTEDLTSLPKTGKYPRCSLRNMLRMY